MNVKKNGEMLSIFKLLHYSSTEGGPAGLHSDSRVFGYAFEMNNSVAYSKLILSGRLSITAVVS